MRTATRLKRFIIQRLPVLQRAQRFLYRLKPYRLKFRAYYLDHGWGSESKSGSGSTLSYTTPLRTRLPLLIAERAISSIVDIPCGDFHWMSHVDLSNVTYIGLDIVEEIIADNRERITRPNIEFRVADLLKDTIPQSDLVICRDCLFHYPSSMVLSALANIKRSNSTYLLTTTFTGLSTNIELATPGLFRKIDLQKPPYNLPKPVELVKEKEDKAMGLWRIEDL